MMTEPRGPGTPYQGKTYASVEKEEVISRCGGPQAVSKAPYALEKIKITLYEMVSALQRDYPLDEVLYPKPEEVIEWAYRMCGGP